MPLTGLFFVKSITIGLVFGALFQNMQVRHCCGRFGCIFFQKPATEGESSAKELRITPALPLTPETLRNFIMAKCVDAIVSIWVWMGLVLNASNLGVSQSVGVIVFFRLALSVSIVCDGVAIILAASATWLFGNYLSDHDPAQRYDYGDSSGSDSSDYDSESDETDSDSDGSYSGSNDSDEDSEEYSDDYGRKNGRSRSRSRSRSRQRSAKTKKKKKKSHDKDDPRTPLSEYDSSDDDDDDDNFILTVGGVSDDEDHEYQARGSSRKHKRSSRKSRRKKRSTTENLSSSKPRVTVPSINFTTMPGGGVVSSSMRWADPGYAQATQREWEQQQQQLYYQQQQQQQQQQHGAQQGYWTMDGQWYDPTNPEAYYASQQQQQQQQQGFVEGDHYASSQPLATARDAVRHAVDAHNIATATSSIGASHEYYSTTGASAAAPLTARDAVRQSASLLGGLNVPRGLVDAPQQ